MNKGGRPSIYSDALAAAVCARIAEGESLRSICRDDAMPSTTTVFLWMTQVDGFAERYARARDEQADTYADEIVAISDERETIVREMDGGTTAVVFDSTAVARNRLRVDARKWVASKLKPKKYGERMQHANDPDNPLVPASVSDDELDARIKALMGKGGA